MNSEIEKRILYSSGNRNNTASITTSNTTKTHLPEWAPAYIFTNLSDLLHHTLPFPIRQATVSQPLLCLLVFPTSAAYTTSSL